VSAHRPEEKPQLSLGSVPNRFPISNCVLLAKAGNQIDGRKKAQKVQKSVLNLRRFAAIKRMNL
jgi:hypothetical protein